MTVTVKCKKLFYILKNRHTCKTSAGGGRRFDEGGEMSLPSFVNK